MIPVYRSEQIRKADAFTVEAEGISSYQLMQRAATAFFREMLVQLGNRKSGCFWVFCGKGNNGGDGFEIARRLRKADYPVRVIQPLTSSDYSADARLAMEAYCADGGGVENFEPGLVISMEDVIVDALIGTGLKDEVNGSLRPVIDFINTRSCLKFSVDIPSGMAADSAIRTPYMVRDSLCLSFQFPKKSFLIPDTTLAPKDFQLLDIGISAEFIQREKAEAYYLEKRDISTWIKERPRFSNKGMFGHALLVAGAKNRGGAAILAAKAVLRSGAGLLSVFSSPAHSIALHTQLPEAMLEAGEDLSGESGYSLGGNLPPMEKYQAVGIGPGLGIRSEELLFQVLENAVRPLVLDADALNILAENPSYLAHLPQNSILTPHPKEFSRLTASPIQAWEDVEKQQAFSDKYGVIVVYKGRHTRISCPTVKGNSIPMLYNSTGNPGMSTAGSGDVLTGIILGLLAQGYEPLQAAAAGVFLHGLAGDIAAAQKGKISLIASDIIEALPLAFQQLKIL